MHARRRLAPRRTHSRRPLPLTGPPTMNAENATLENRALIERFYHAFQQRDGAAMAACYHANASFRDPVFELEGARVGAMWRMLTSRGADLRVEFGNISADAG